MSLSRVRALAILSGLLLIAVIVVTWALIRDKQASSNAADAECPKAYLVVNAKSPAPKDIRVNVFNGTDHVGLASTVAEGLQKEKFEVLSTANDPLRRNVKDVVELRYGPKTVGAAHVLRAYFLLEGNNAGFDPSRGDDVVDVVLGPDFKQLGSPTEVKQKMGALGEAQLPTNTCAAR